MAMSTACRVRSCRIDLVVENQMDDSPADCLTRTVLGIPGQAGRRLGGLDSAFISPIMFNGFRFLDRGEGTEYCSRTFASPSAFAEGFSRSRTGGREAPPPFHPANIWLPPVHSNAHPFR